MRKMLNIMLLALFGLIALAGAGCKDSVPQSELDRFVAEVNAMEDSAQLALLNDLATTGDARAAFANYMLGNRLYQEAGEISLSRGWNDGQVNALLDSAEVYFELSLQQDTTFVEALVNLGSLWDDRSEQMGNPRERENRVNTAREYYDKALAVDPANEKARCNLGTLYLRQRQTAEAVEQFKTVLEMNPASSLAHYNMAIMFAEQKIYREAIREWELAVKHDPDGDIGQRSRDNIKIVKELMNAPTPDNVK